VLGVFGGWGFFDRQGNLVASTMQEGVMRQR